jgi:hypothetical protein
MFDSIASGAVVGAVAGVLATVIGIVIYYGKRGSVKIASKIKREAKKIQIKTQESDEAYYLAAIDECEKGRSPGLWAKALTLEKGNEELAKFRYVELRVPQLKKEAANLLDKTAETNDYFVQDTPRAPAIEEKSSTESEYPAMQELFGAILLIACVGIIVTVILVI